LTIAFNTDPPTGWETSVKKLEFQGYSDDTFACEGPRIDVDCDNAGSGKPVTMRLDSAEGSLVVRGQYAPGPCAGWLIGIAPAENGRDEQHIPAWPIQFGRSEREYSPKLTIEAPDDVVVTLIDEKGKPLPAR
jgi:hypothetical protein